MFKAFAEIPVGQRFGTEGVAWIKVSDRRAKPEAHMDGDTHFFMAHVVVEVLSPDQQPSPAPTPTALKF